MKSKYYMEYYTYFVFRVNPVFLILTTRGDKHEYLTIRLPISTVSVHCHIDTDIVCYTCIIFSNL